MERDGQPAPRVSGCPWRCRALGGRPAAGCSPCRATIAPQAAQNAIPSVARSASRSAASRSCAVRLRYAGPRPDATLSRSMAAWSIHCRCTGTAGGVRARGPAAPMGLGRGGSLALRWTRRTRGRVAGTWTADPARAPSARRRPPRIGGVRNRRQHRACARSFQGPIRAVAAPDCGRPETRTLHGPGLTDGQDVRSEGVVGRVAGIRIRRRVRGRRVAPEEPVGWAAATSH
jgi:hypothetical protein